MKKLLALSIALLSLNLYGADDPFPSQWGLEGFGQKDSLGNTGINISIYIHEQSDQQLYHDKDLYDKQHIIDTVELALRRAGIKINKNSLHMIRITARPQFIGADKVVDNKFVGKLECHEIEISLRRRLQFKHNGKTYRWYGRCGSSVTFRDFKVSDPAYDAKNLYGLKAFVDQKVDLIKRESKKEPKPLPFKVLPPLKKAPFPTGKSIIEP